MRIAPAECQKELVAAFESGSVGGASAPVERIDTHISHVFLSGDRAFKLKRSVALPFVDFSTIEQRRRACAAEIVANKIMDGVLYEGAAPVTFEGSKFAIAGAGAIVDWVVVMRRFDQTQQFDRLAQRGALSLKLIEEIVETIARAHLGAPAVEAAGRPAHYREIIQGLRRTTQDGAQRFGLDLASMHVFERLDSEMTRLSGLIERRCKLGKVRRGHGDLHLRNICVFDGRPTAFDALEFDDRLATADVLYDLAFLLTDLARVGLKQHANVAMNCYWDLVREEETGLALLPFFMSLRAAVRLATSAEAGDLTEARIYSRLSLELLEQSKPALIAVGGLSGAGKTAVAQALAPRLPGPAGARLLRTDVLRKTGLGLAMTEAAPEAAYEAAARVRVYRELARRAASALKAGANVVADATFLLKATRELMEAAAGASAFAGYWLSAPLEARLARVARRSGDASDANLKVATAQSEPTDLSQSWRRLDAGGPVDPIVDAILEQRMREGPAST